MLNESKFNMWRACIAIIHVDGNIAKEELQWAMEKINSIKMSSDQKNLLNEDLKKSPDLKDLLKKITHKPDLAFLLHMVRVISHLDNNYSSQEKDTYNALEKMILKGIDLEEIEHLITDLKEKDKFSDFEVTNKKSIFEKSFKSLLKVIN